MARQQKLSKELIIETAFSLLRTEYLEAISARKISKVLKCSTQPIYNLYKNMDELKLDLDEKIKTYCHDFILNYKKTGNRFLDSGLGYINFAKTEKNLFKYISLKNKTIINFDLTNFIGDEKIHELMLEYIDENKYSAKDLQVVFLKTMVFSFGLATLAYSEQLNINDDEIAKLLLDTFENFITSLSAK